MTNFYEAVEILKETRKAIRRADGLIERALTTKSHPSAPFATWLTRVLA